jgi:hypothetical protein
MEATLRATAKISFRICESKLGTFDLQNLVAGSNIDSLVLGFWGDGGVRRSLRRREVSSMNEMHEIAYAIAGWAEQYFGWMDLLHPDMIGVEVRIAQFEQNSYTFVN